LGLATERIIAAVEAARAMPVPLVLTARAENFVRDVPDLDDTIKRLQAYENAGADVLFAPSLPGLDAVRAVVVSITRPLSVVGLMQGGSLRVQDYAEAGVKRISLATALYNAAMTGLHWAAQEIQRDGTFSFCRKSIDGDDIDAFMPS
jgi:2-methylisocitrate lyase-like PEP mutase family enzyme